MAVWKRQQWQYTIAQGFNWSMTSTIQKERISKGMHYHHASLMTYNSCIHNGYWKPIQTEQQTKALSFITSRTTGPWQFLWAKMSQSQGRLNLKFTQKVIVWGVSHIMKLFAHYAEQIWACTAKAACPWQHSLHLKKLQNHHSEKLRLKELTRGFRRKQYNKAQRNTTATWTWQLFDW